MRKNNLGTIGLLAGGLIAGVGITATQGCDAADNLCGPCGTIATGQLSIAGNAQLDGFFAATASLQNATVKINGDFEANILALADVYGVGDGSFSATLVDELIAKIQADFDANLDGGIKVTYAAPKCEANIDVSVKAQANCEVEAKCDVMVDPGEVSVKCEGQCSGGCSAECMGDLACEVKTPTVACEGKCEGACQLDVAAACEGTCNGDCSGNCSATDAGGKCAGSCDGECSGTCTVSAGASCSGTCQGSCLVQPGSAQCTAEASCRGTCMGECSGGCSGKATPPSASANCEASGECSAQAEAQGSASLECTPPSLEITYAFSAGVNAEAQAQFLARIGELKVRGIAIIQGFAKFEALFNGKIDGEVVFPEPPVAQITASLNGIISAGVSGDLNIPAGRLPCVIPALQEAVKVLADIGASAAGTIEAQGKFAAFITSSAG